MKYKELDQKNVLITGGTQGIGEAMADAFNAEAAHVIVNGRKLNKKVEKVLQRTGAQASMGDIADPASAVKVVEKTAEFCGGKLDVLVCNAAGMSMTPFLMRDSKEWWQQIRINLTGHINCIKAALPIMKNHGGTIIIISSFFGTIGWNNATGYGASKSGLLTMGQHLARLFREDDIKVCTIIPGVIDTPQLQVDANDLNITLDEVREMYAGDIAMKRIADPAEIAEAALFMASDAGRNAMNGRHLIVSGGEYRSTPYYI